MRRDRAEWDEHPEAWAVLLAAARRCPVTLLHGARDGVHNSAVALQRFLEERLAGWRGGAGIRALVER